MPISKQTIITLWEGPENGDTFSLGPFSSLSLALVYPSYLVAMGNSQSQPSKFTPLGCHPWNLKALGFQGDIRPKRLIYYSNTVWPQYRLNNRSQWSENGTLEYNTLRDLDNFCCHNSKSQKSLMFRLSSLSTLWLLSYFSNTCSPLWATSS